MIAGFAPGWCDVLLRCCRATYLGRARPEDIDIKAPVNISPGYEVYIQQQNKTKQANSHLRIQAFAVISSHLEKLLISSYHTNKHTRVHLLQQCLPRNTKTTTQPNPWSTPA